MRSKKDIYERVILNDEAPQITTPYFKFYENQVHCQSGNVYVSMNEKEVCVLADISGGTLFIGNESYTLKAGEETVVGRA